MTNHELATAFEQIADLLELQGANPFRVRAYRNAARAIHDLPQAAADLVAEQRDALSRIEGIGKDLAEKAAVLLETGTLPLLEELRAAVPESVLALLRVPGLGPKRAAQLYHELNVATLEQLRQACAEHKIQALKGFGPKLEAAILEGLDLADQSRRRILWIEADQIVQEVFRHMHGCRAIQRIAAAGSYRRGKDTVGDLDFLVVARDASAVMERLEKFPSVEAVLQRGETKMSVRLVSGVQVDLRVVQAESFGAALQYFTGSKEHNIMLRSRAKLKDLKINEYGVFRGEMAVAGREEEEVYAALDLPCFLPELREARREFEWADAGQLPELIKLDDLCGDLHVHSTWTDGQATIAEIAQAAKKRSLKYIAITDHSQRVAMVGGLNAERLREQWAEIDRLNRRLHGFTVLKGVEVDILEGGGLDLPDEVLAAADWVVASIHYGQNQPREQITRRAIEALQNPYVHALGHPTGRMLLRRQPYQIDLEAVMRVAQAHGKMLELNAHPQRLDLDDVACAAAKSLGILVAIGTDAHHADGLDYLRCGVLQARRGGLTKADVVNCLTWPQLRRLLAQSRR